MKKLFLLLFIAIVANTSFAQTVPDKANTIIIAMSMSDSNAVKEKVMKVLEDRDYKVRPNNKAPQTITTVPKTLKENARVSFIADIKGTEIYLTGFMSIAAQNGMRIEYKGKKGTPIMTAWEEMEKVAKAFGGKMKYEVK